MNTWETAAYQYSHGVYGDTQNALFYPDIYSRGRYDMLSILADINGRPNPQVHLGPVDLSCPMILCDLEGKDQEIVYANQEFCCMTGYSLKEVIGKNCRFLQTAKTKIKPSRKQVSKADKDAVQKMRKALETRTEVQVEVLNFKKNGQPFVNILTMIPVMVGGRVHCVGFQCEKE